MLKDFLHINLLLLIGVFALLVSCKSHVSTPDGPPNFYVDETKIANAVPRYEPLAKFGNMPSYRVDGKRYYTQSACTNYEEVGLASWYGTKFHRKRTSSGEPYDMLAMTAAHKTLPLPTYVEVTNLRNHRKIIVKVNDRGPFAANRVIDLSYVAAKKLDMLGRGTTLVRLRTIDPTHFGQELQLAKNTHQQHPIYLQVGAFKNKSNALSLRYRLSGILHTTVHVATPPTHHALYKVKVGPIKDVATANHLAKTLENLGYRVIND